ncbi:MAG: hypothetical protein H8E76_08215 [Helicobacteraceae bacterium]|nr:hypothetical protein [Candidatus Sulfurimonas ponti]
MSVLTQSERDGLDEVFLSINANNKNYIKVFKELFNLAAFKYVVAYCKNVKQYKRV